ncbi:MULTISPECIES: dGTPase [Gammaproteobacteria]|uniref:dGTPase n=1 Tax=Gammaproteobacteria TaxID=1236 RepID=UPI000DCFCB9D|nr:MULTISPECIES: dGTPase [Gammaproteobacteria]RTE85792.1 dGTPase [Aliidiomarina sp. B3213]TCZ90206.1 dGTPase [Lysobacter sp. N42]
MTDFSKKITATRPVASNDFDGDGSLLRAFESDRGRIINSAAIRRLQQKTQVFPLERNAAVRSRLTHSLEVQQTGRFISQQIFRELQKTEGALEQYGLKNLNREFESLVEMACLMHDMGNPPFGHFGEAAISQWFEKKVKYLKAFKKDTSNSQLFKIELANFEGNAQAIRLIANLQRLNLTYAQAACVLKYTRAASEAKPKDGDPFDYLKKKPGFYYSEKEYVKALLKALDIDPGHRFPLTYVMEAADDISYCLADIEDGVDKDLLTLKELVKLLSEEFQKQCKQDPNARHFNGLSFNDIVQQALEAAQQESINKSHVFFIKLRVLLIYPLVHHAAKEFVGHIEEVFDGSLNRALLEDGSPEHAVIETLKKVARRHIFSTPEVETLELQGYQILTGVLEHYAPLLELSEKDFTLLLDSNAKNKPLRESRLFNRLPNKHVKAYVEMKNKKHDDPEVWEMYCRCRLLQDMVSGMTDQFALDEYRTLSAGAVS